MKMADNMEFAIIVPIFQTPQILDIFLNSVANTISYPSRIIFIDDGSSPNTAKLLNDFRVPLGCSLEILRHSHSLGCAKSINEALDLLDENQRYIVFLDSDLILQSDWQQEIVKSFTQEKIGIVGGILTYPQTGGIQCCGITFNLNSCKHLYLNSKLDIFQNKDNFEVQSTVFAFCAIKKEAVDKVGKIDETFYNGYEDFDLQMRIRKAGYSAIINTHINLYHWEKSNGPHRSLNQKRNLAHFWHKHGNFIRDDLENFLYKRINMISDSIKSGYYCIDLCEDRTSAKWLLKKIADYKKNFIKETIDYSFLCNSNIIWLPEILDSTCAFRQEPLLFICENFVSLSENYYWWELRKQVGFNDLIIDLYGNAILFRDLAINVWPGRKIR